MSETIPKSQPSLNLKVEDFERLGVRPDEMRLTVIRRAATQTSRTLAQSQLANPSETAALQLSRVTVSAYRLLDPRLRGDAHQRIHVGRILPTVLLWAGQTKFQNQQAGGRRGQMSGVGLSGAIVTGNAGASIPFEGGGLSDSDLIELMELDSTPLLAGQPAWAHNFSDVDILGRTLFFKRWNRWKRVLLSRWYTIGLTVILIGLFIAALVIGSSRDEPLVTEDVDRTSSVRQGVAKSDTAEFGVSARPGDSRTAVEQILDLEEGWGALDESDVALTDVLDSDSQGEDPIISLDLMQETIIELENPVSDTSTSNNPPSNGGEMIEPVRPGLEKDRPAFLPDPFDNATEKMMLKTDELGSEPDDRSVSSTSVADSGQHDTIVQPATGAKSEDAPNVVKTSKQGVPDSEALADARRRIVSLDSMSLTPGSPDDVTQRVLALEELRDSLKLGTVDYWAVTVLLMESAWQTQGVSDVNRNLVDLHQIYQFAPASLLVETYMAANVRSALPEIQRCLLANGLVLVDQLLIADQVELAMRILDSLESLGLTLQNTESMEYVAAYGRAISQTMRQRERFRTLLLEDSNTWSRSNRGLLGRYYCFVLRRWETGLAWLSNASDSRIAAAAKSELSLPEEPGFEDLMILARRWNFTAEKASGLNRDAIRLHAVFLAGKAMAKASESERLEFGKELGDLSEALPQHLRSEGFPLLETSD